VSRPGVGPKSRRSKFQSQDCEHLIFDLGHWTLDLGLDRERVPVWAKAPLTGCARLLKTTCPGRISAHRSDADRWDSRRWVHPPYINCEGPVPAGPLLGGPGGTTCPGAPRLPPRPVRWERAGLRRAQSSRVSGRFRVPSRHANVSGPDRPPLVVNYLVVKLPIESS
jgi:hypothetical protein